MVVFSIAGTMWILEGLGDLEGYADHYMLSGMGEISFFQMVYFTFMTISTVGYGDYSPTTVFSRTFIVFATLGGVSVIIFPLSFLLKYTYPIISSLSLCLVLLVRVGADVPVTAIGGERLW